MTTCGHDHEDGAYVLGALSPEERVAFERHLPGCAECAQSVRELAGLPGLLARVPVEILDPEQLPTPVPDTLLPALVREVRRSHRRRTWLTAGLVAAAAAVAICAVGVATLGGDDDGRREAGPTIAPTIAQTATPTVPTTAPTTAAPVLMSPVGDEPISGWLSLTQVGWGTRLELECSYAEESEDYHDPAWSTYTMVVRTGDGASEQVASWKAVPGKTMRLAAATASDVDDIARVEVRTAAGETVLEYDA
ncbi:anti-sigma factor family protein [Nocardioides halotolerans]|uniref:anti-sigma factor family protein n=1 Tax=Nocardioides halotolerans TaxID=433660 RepID=UPI0003F99773|nr:zf-HC2 domain-containing protein [Nocardioides halotolerans]